MKHKLKLIIKRFILILVILYIFENIYLILKINYYIYESYHNKTYCENSFISEELYYELHPFYYSRRIDRDNYIIDKDTEQYKSYYSYIIIYPNSSATFNRGFHYETYYKKVVDDDTIIEESLYGASTILHIELKLKSFHWVVENIYEDI